MTYLGDLRPHDIFFTAFLLDNDNTPCTRTVFLACFACCSYTIHAPGAIHEKGETEHCNVYICEDWELTNDWTI